MFRFLRNRNFPLFHFGLKCVGKIELELGWDISDVSCISVHSDANQTRFRMKGSALGLVLKQRQKATREWPIL